MYTVKDIDGWTDFYSSERETAPEIIVDLVLEFGHNVPTKVLKERCNIRLNRAKLN